VPRLLTRRRFLFALSLFALVGGGVWWFFSPRLTDEEKPFVGRWTWAVSYPNPPFKKPPHPPGSVWVINVLPDRTARHAIFLPDGTQAGKSFAAKWRVENGELVLDFRAMYDDGLFGLLKSPPSGTESRHPVVAVYADRLELRFDAVNRAFYGDDALLILSRNDAAPAPSENVMTGKDMGF
jgi:hypothetical protein